MKFTSVALFGAAAALAVAQKHNHVHRHPARHGSPLERRVETTTTVAGPVVTVYELNGQVISPEDVKKGVEAGRYVLVGDKISSVIPASTTSTSTSSTPTPTPSSSTSQAAFLEVKTSSAPAPAVPTIPAVQAASQGSQSSTDASAVTKKFPSGEIPCSTFPSAYGAVRADWLGLGGWTGIQKTPNFDLASAAISYIETAISGSGCTANAFCSYACPAGYQKAQWPKAQGAKGESVGGLFCNSDGKLEITRSEYATLCQPGAGNVKASSTLGKNVAICRTDYPGTESETVALNVAPGSTVEVTCPDSKDYYTWEGSATSAQYYINPSGYGVEEACKWGSAGSNIGNWAPVNMGVGKGPTGETFISLFQNAPTNPDGVLDFNIHVTGGVSGDCKYENGKFYNNGAESPSGCTVSIQDLARYYFLTFLRSLFRVLLCLSSHRP